VHPNDPSPADEDNLEEEIERLQNSREALIRCLAVQKVPSFYFTVKPERLELLYNASEKDLAIPRNILTEIGMRSFLLRELG